MNAKNKKEKKRKCKQKMQHKMKTQPENIECMPYHKSKNTKCINEYLQKIKSSFS